MKCSEIILQSFFKQVFACSNLIILIIIIVSTIIGTVLCYIDI
jgi:hypothetical protein